MEWLPFALWAYVLLSLCSLLSKVLISQFFKSTIVYLIFFGFWNFLPLLLIPFRGFFVPSLGLFVLAFLSGVLYVGLLIPYFQALKIEEASRVVPLWRFTPLFILLFSSGFSCEMLDPYQMGAFLLLVVGGFLVSLKHLSDLFHPTKAFYLMVFSSFLSGLYSTIAKFVYLKIDFYDGFTIMRASFALCAIAFLLIPKHRKEAIVTIKSMNQKVRGLIALNSIFEVLGIASYNFAMSLAPVSLVSASAGIQAIFVLIFSIALSFKCPELLCEDMSHRALTQKGFAIVLIVIGTGMISHP